MSKLLLVTFDDNYADEFNIYGFKVMYERDFLKMMDRTRDIIEGNSSTEYYFGTNEYVQYSSFEEYENALTIKEITQDEADTLLKLFGEPGRVLVNFGHFIDPTEYEDDYDWDEEWEDEEDEDETPGSRDGVEY